MHFEFIVLEKFFKLINNKNETAPYGYSKIDCIFALNEIEKEKVTCFDKFDTTEENAFFMKIIC